MSGTQLRRSKTHFRNVLVIGVESLGPASPRLGTARFGHIWLVEKAISHRVLAVDRAGYFMAACVTWPKTRIGSVHEASREKRVLGPNDHLWRSR